MSTNYYLRVPACGNACEHCARAQEIHLGQAAGGWRFLHRAYREYQPVGVDFPVVDRESWTRLLDLGEIFDEYGAAVAREDLIGSIEDDQEGRPRDPHGEYSDYGYFSVDGYDFSDSEFC